MSYKNNISLNIVVLDEWGDLLEDLDASTFPPVFVAPEVGSNITDTITDLSDLDDNHTPWGIYERGNGIYRLDLPDLPAGNYKVYGFSSGASIVPQKITVDLENRLFDEVVYSANTGFVTIDSLANELGTVDRLNNHLIRITDSSGRIQERWIRSHFHSSGRAGFNPDLDFNPTPQVGDRIEIFSGQRGAVNLVNWRGTVPNNLVSNRVDSSVGSMANNVITSSSITNEALTDSKFSSGFFSAIWSNATRTLTSISDSAGITTLLERITGLIRTKSEDDIADGVIISEIEVVKQKLESKDNEVKSY